ncbi:MAG: hypothetical protein ACFFDF_01130 [Candidatus Odinarchaeota archaeon]
MKFEINIPEKIIDHLKKVRPRNFTISEYFEIIIKNEIESRFDDL